MAKHKYGAIRTTVFGITFASKAEARRYVELLLRAKAGEIENLELQPKFPLIVAGQKIGTYIADFRYAVRGKGVMSRLSRLIVEDVKGMKTPVYNIKKKLVRALYGIEITEVR